MQEINISTQIKTEIDLSNLTGGQVAQVLFDRLNELPTAVNNHFGPDSMNPDSSMRTYVVLERHATSGAPTKTLHLTKAKSRWRIHCMINNGQNYKWGNQTSKFDSKIKASIEAFIDKDIVP